MITVRLTGHSSCSPHCVASIKFWLVNDCLFFAGHMESALYSLSLYSHWLTPATDVWTVIGPYCCCAPCHTATNGLVSPNGCNLLFFLEIIAGLCRLYSAAQTLERWSEMEQSHGLKSILWRVCIQEVLLSFVVPLSYILSCDPTQSSLVKRQKKADIFFMP